MRRATHLHELGRSRQILIASASALAVAALLFPFTAKPFSSSWDELVYMGLAFRPEAQAWRLNRYAHVYALMPFMRLTGDPYIGARLFWSCSVGLTVVLLVRAALSETAVPRWLAAGLVLLFFAGQEDIFDCPGIAYDEYTAMPAIAAAFCVVWTRIAHGRTLAQRDAAVVGLSLFIAIKATEIALPALLLAAVFFITPSGRLRFDRTALRLAAGLIGGIAVGMIVLMGLDLVCIGDPLFSLRPSSWQELLGYNFPATSVPDVGYVELRWLIRPEILRALLLYAVSGVLWIRIEPDARRQFLYLFPLAFSAMLGLLEFVGRLDFVPRYTIPALPLLCFLPAIALSRLLPDARQARGVRGSAAALFAGVGIAIVALAGGHALAALVGISADRVERVVASGLTLAACAILLATWTRPRLAGTLAVPAIVAAVLVPVWRVTTELAQRDAQRAGEAWFGGFYEVARAAQLERGAIIFVSDRLYDGTIRPPMVPTLTRLNFNLPLAPAQIVRGAAPGPNADYAVIPYAELDARRAAHGTDPPDAIVSTDRMVALVCMRGPCRRAR